MKRNLNRSARATAAAFDCPGRVPQQVRDLTIGLAAAGLISILATFFFLYRQTGHRHISVGVAIAVMVAAYVLIFGAGLWIFMRYGMPLITTQTEQLQRTLEAQLETNRRQKEFLTHVHHELRTPVTVVLGATELLHSRGDEIPAEQRLKLRASARRHAKSLADLVESLVDGVDESLPGLGSDVPSDNWTSLQRN